MKPVVSAILSTDEARYTGTVPIVIVGAGACGLTAALAASDSHAEMLVLERDAKVAGTTAMSTGLIPAAGTDLQRAKGIIDTPAQFASDILRKTGGETDVSLVHALARESAATVHWLIDQHDIELSLVETFLYPGHTALRMHGTPNRTGAELAAMLESACMRRDIPILTQALVETLFVDAARSVRGLRVRRPDDTSEDIACEALVLACSGFAGNREMLAEFIPEILDAEFFGHPGNKGDAIRWGRALGAAIKDIGGYQGHGGLAADHGIPILWPLIMEGGFQVNIAGERFSNEARGYSEQAVEVVRQPQGLAWMIYDERLHRLMMEFRDYLDAVDARAIVSAADLRELAKKTGLPGRLATTLHEVDEIVAGRRSCPFGRDFSGKPPLSPPYYAVKVRGALFHTQGGLAVDSHARVLHNDGTPFPNLFAGGGAARGVSGPSSSGYLAGNGLLTATTLGRLAGEEAARLIQNARPRAPAQRKASS